MRLTNALHDRGDNCLPSRCQRVRRHTGCSPRYVSSPLPCAAFGIFGQDGRLPAPSSEFRPHVVQTWMGRATRLVSLRTRPAAGSRCKTWRLLQAAQLPACSCLDRKYRWNLRLSASERFSSRASVPYRQFCRAGASRRSGKHHRNPAAFRHSRGCAVDCIRRAAAPCQGIF